MISILPSYQIITRNELFERHPKLKTLFDAGYIEGDDDNDNDNDDDEEDNNHYAFYFEGDTVLDMQQLKALDKEPGACIIAVNGNLNLPGKCPDNIYVDGDLYCDVYSPGDYYTTIIASGTINARHYAYFFAEDDEDFHEVRYPCKVDTPYLFSWFGDIKPLLASAETVVFLVCDHADYKKMNLANPCFYWQDDIYCLKPELCYEIEGRWSDAPYWNIHAIEHSLEQGQSIFIDGFDMACWASWKKATEHLATGQHKKAFACYREVMTIAPNWYPAWLKAGDLLFDLGAYQQSLPFFEKAISLFPALHKKLNIEAADLWALAQVRLLQLDKAIEMATFSINRCKENEWDNNIRSFAYRIRGEAYILKEDWKNAKTDLKQALEMGAQKGPAVWLMGLVYHHFGDKANAVKYHTRAQQNGGQYAKGYDNHQHSGFIYFTPSAMVDWL